MPGRCPWHGDGPVRFTGRSRLGMGTGLNQSGISRFNRRDAFVVET